MKFDDRSIDQAIEQASANSQLEGSNLAISEEERQKIKEDLQQGKSLLLAFVELYNQRQSSTSKESPEAKGTKKK